MSGTRMDVDTADGEAAPQQQQPQGQQGQPAADQTNPGPGANKRRRGDVKRKVDEAFARISGGTRTHPQVPTEDFGSYPKNIDISEQAQLERVFPRDVMYQWRADSTQGSFLENQVQTLNWIVQYNNSTALSKAAFDWPACMALAATLMSQMEAARANYAVVVTQCTPAANGRAPPPRDSLTLAQAQPHQDIVFRRQLAAKDPSARLAAAPAAAPDGDAAPAPRAANTLAVPKKCNNCGKKDHYTLECVMPSEDLGPIRACFICGNGFTDHTADDCPVARKVTWRQAAMDKMETVLLVLRARRPQFRSDKLNVFSFMTMLKDLGGKDTEWLNKSAVDLPWTPGFTREVMKAVPGKGILAGKIHPMQFDYSKHKTTHLPADPYYHGKTYGNIIDEYQVMANRREMLSLDNEGKATLEEMRRQLNDIGLLNPNEFIDLGNLTALCEKVRANLVILPAENAAELVFSPFAVVEQIKEGTATRVIKFTPLTAVTSAINKETQSEIWQAIRKMARRELTTVSYRLDSRVETILAKLLREMLAKNKEDVSGW
ncbi:hypothetical protein B0T16DRAFT_393175 [Cercophora newfieldiana]|uniref:CCHC-type domain-containing protein n=1 Tax=Cercophora newfieldiana TaxID=92897 RepID=A0AA40CJK2_9PEZI|nr:hypothetical protein B0T16DRAFT_393175 [Cercophora newfieldiana]